MAQLLPRLVMRNRNYNRPAKQWYLETNSSGKSFYVRSRGTSASIAYWSFQSCPQENKFFGFSTAWSESVIGIASSFGKKSQVVNIGMEVMQLALPRNVSACKYAEAFAHKVRRLKPLLIRVSLLF